MEEIMERIEINPKVLTGKTIIRGTHIPVELIRAAVFYTERLIKE